MYTGNYKEEIKKRRDEKQINRVIENKISQVFI